MMALQFNTKQWLRLPSFSLGSGRQRLIKLSSNFWTCPLCLMNKSTVCQSSIQESPSSYVLVPCYSRPQLWVVSCLKEICMYYECMYVSFFLWCQEASSSSLVWYPCPTTHRVDWPPQRSRLHRVASSPFISTKRNNDFKPVMKSQ